MMNSDDDLRLGKPERLVTIAHRAGNDLSGVRGALDVGVDFVEADIRLFKGCAEVRHAKTLGSRLLWEPGEMARRSESAVASLNELLTALPDDQHRLMLDLKGPRRGLAPIVAGAIREHAPEAPIAVTTPHWWMFSAFSALPNIRVVPSAGSWPMVERLRAMLRKGRWPHRTPFGCSIHRTLLSAEIAGELQRRVDHVFTWPVDTDDELAEARRLGVTGITSRDLGLLQDVLAGH